MASPAWLAAAVQVPALSSVKVLPLTVQTAVVSDAKDTAKPELAVAAKGAAGVPSVWLPGEGKSSACASRVAETVTLCATAAAAR